MIYLPITTLPEFRLISDDGFNCELTKRVWRPIPTSFGCLKARQERLPLVTSLPFTADLMFALRVSRMVRSLMVTSEVCEHDRVTFDIRACVCAYNYNGEILTRRFEYWN